MSEINRAAAGARLLVTAFAGALILGAAAPALANGPPSREGNIWDWRAHQPQQGAVSAKEHAAGIAQAPQARDRTMQELDRLNRELLSRGNPPGGGSAAGQSGR